jgi:DNA-binding Xre family transcriptional regulator
MVKTHVREMAEKRGITTAYQLQKALEISPSVAAKLWSDDFELISKTSLNRLCQLLRCKPDQLISFKPDSKFKGKDLMLVANRKVGRPKKAKS